MKKILILFFFITACGYQPLYTQKEEILFGKITLLDDKKINRKIISSTAIKIDTKNADNKEIILKSNKKTLTTSRDAKGQPATFRSEINVSLIIKKNNVIIKEKVFSENFDYNNMTNKYDLSEYQIDVENNLINKIVEDLIIFINI
tara:strand:+ start:3371 stop:3808 length:438 start_codon:yes stop_codon:yes gene_type:complete